MLKRTDYTVVVREEVSTQLKGHWAAAYRKPLYAKGGDLMKRIFFIILLCLISSTCIAYDGSPEDQVKQFFHDLLAGKSNEAIDNLYSTNPAIQQKIQHITVMKQQVGMTATLYGKSIEVEDFVVEKITPSITRIVKVVKHEVHPVVWEFYFYKSHNKWVASQSLYNDQFKFLHKK